MSEVKVNKISPRTGTELELGDSGDTIKTSGSLDTNNNNIITASNRDLNLYPNGTGAVEIGGNTNPGTIILNCESNSHGIKLQSPAHSAGQSYTIKFPTGNITAGKFLKVASITGSGATGVGQLSFDDAGGGSLVKLASTTISSAVAAVSFNSTYINSTYDNYRVIAYGLSTASNNQDIALRMSVDDGSNFATHVGMFEYAQINAGSTGSAGVGNRSSIPLGSDEAGADSGGTNFAIDLFNLNSTTQYKFGSGLGTVQNQGGGPDYYGYRVHGYIASNTAVNFFKIFTEAGGNLDKGTVTLYGYEK
jgi:hypothetical protein|tara:strand:+ start:840 stop:1757 length:918 start_codon:yes stop_codon:yes gene_type:complete